MNSYLLIWVYIALAGTIPLIFLMRRAYLNRRVPSDDPYITTTKHPATIIALSMTLGVTAALSVLIRPAPLWLHLFQLEAFTYMYLLNYSVNVWLTSGKPYNFLHGRLTYVTIVATCLVSFLGYRSSPNYGHLVLNDPVQPTRLYATYYGFGLAITLLIQLQIIRLFISSIMHNQDLTYIIRRSIGLVAMIGVTIGTCAAALNLAFFLRYGPVYQRPLNIVYYATTPMITSSP